MCLEALIGREVAGWFVGSSFSLSPFSCCSTAVNVDMTRAAPASGFITHSKGTWMQAFLSIRKVHNLSFPLFAIPWLLNYNIINKQTNWSKIQRQMSKEGRQNESTGRTKVRGGRRVERRSPQRKREDASKIDASTITVMANINY